MPQPRGVVALPTPLERLSVSVARLPWWAILIAVMLFLAFYAIATSDLYRRVMVFVTDNPQVTTNQFARVTYDVKGADGKTTRIGGILNQDNGSSVVITTQAEQQATVSRDDIAKLTCASPAADGSCPLNEPVTIIRSTAEGTLILEDLGKYQIKTVLGDTEDVLKIITANEARTPDGCSPDPNGGCAIKITLKSNDSRNAIAGKLVDTTPSSLIVQTVPPVTATINKSDIVNVVSATPLQCALNNISACNEGIFLTLGVTFLSYALALILGLILGLMRVSSNVVFFNFSTMYVEVLRGVPLLVILLFVNFAFAPWFRDNFPGYAPTLRLITLVLGILLLLYYVASRWSRRQTDPLELIQPAGIVVFAIVALVLIISFFGAHSDLDVVQRAILGLALGYGAFTAELFRAGIQSIGRGQMEASRSLGMSYVQAMRFIVLPQAFRVILPPLGNDFIAMLKDTSLVAFLALPELTQKARLFASDTYRPFEAYLTIGVLYLCMTLFLSFLVRVVEHRTNMPR